MTTAPYGAPWHGWPAYRHRVRTRWVYGVPLADVNSCFKLFRTAFLRKASPVHFFWGSFDLAVTRFSGRTAPLHPGGVPGLSLRITARGIKSWSLMYRIGGR